LEGLELTDKREWITLPGSAFYYRTDGDSSGRKRMYPLIPDGGFEIDGGIEIKSNVMSNIIDYIDQFKYKVTFKLPSNLDKALNKVLFKEPIEDFEDKLNSKL
jgi:hypothetical protein